MVIFENDIVHAFHRVKVASKLKTIVKGHLQNEKKKATNTFVHQLVKNNPPTSFHVATRKTRVQTLEDGLLLFA